MLLTLYPVPTAGFFFTREPGETSVTQMQSPHPGRCILGRLKKGCRDKERKTYSRRKNKEIKTFREGKIECRKRERKRERERKKEKEKERERQKERKRAVGVALPFQHAHGPGSPSSDYFRLGPLYMGGGSRSLSLLLENQAVTLDILDYRHTRAIIRKCRARSHRAVANGAAEVLALCTVVEREREREGGGGGSDVELGWHRMIITVNIFYIPFNLPFSFDTHHKKFKSRIICSLHYPPSLNHNLYPRPAHSRSTPCWGRESARMCVWDLRSAPQPWAARQDPHVGG